MIEDIIRDIYEEVKDKVLYVTFAGSSALPFIKNPKDLDIIFVVNSLEDKKICVHRYFKKFNTQELHTKYNIDIHFDISEHDQKHYLTVNYYARDFWPYENLKLPRLRYDFTIEGNQDKLRAALIDSYQHLKFVWKDKLDKIWQSKKWYRIYFDLCVYKNNSFELTEEQIDNINLLHDAHILANTESRKQLINEIISEVDQWQI